VPESLARELPLWLLFTIACGLAVAAIELGFRAGAARAKAREHEQSGPVGAVVGAVLGLLAFMMAFTFSLAANRFEARKSLLLEEVNAIGTAYLRAGLLPEPQRSDSQRLLREYAALRADVGAVIRESDGIARFVTRSETLHERLWSQAGALVTAGRASPVEALFVSALNEVFDLHTERVVFAAHYRIPTVVWSILAIASMLAMAILGFSFGLSGRRSVFASLIVAVMYSSILLLIGDLDRPLQGLLSVSQQPMIELSTKLEASRPDQR